MVEVWNSKKFSEPELLYELCGITVFRAQDPDGQRVLLKCFNAAKRVEWDIGLLEVEAALCWEHRLACFPECLRIWNEDEMTWACYSIEDTLSLDHFMHVSLLNTVARVQLCQQILEAVSQMHEIGLVHRTLCPHLIRISRDGKRIFFQDLYYVVQEGFRTALIQDLPFPQVSLPYMAAEQFGEIESQSSRTSDYYALGQVFYWIFAGTPAFVNTDPRELLYSHLAIQAKVLHKVIEGLPMMLSLLVQKMTAKIVVDRYLTLSGLQYDLQLIASIIKGEVPNSTRFTLGAFDVPKILVVPGKIYGQAETLTPLLKAVDGFLQGRSTLIMLRGTDSNAKSLLVRELWRPLAKSRGYLLQGVMQKSRVGLPYETLMQAIDLHLLQLLYRPRKEQDYWQRKITEAGGRNLGALTEILPSLQLLCPGTKALASLQPKQQESRFELGLKTLLRVLCEPNHPLILFLDQLQYMDASTARILQRLLIKDPVPNLLLIGAFPEDALEKTTFFEEFLEIAGKRDFYHEISTGVLGSAEIENLLKDMLRSHESCPAGFIEELTVLSQGNMNQAALIVHRLAELGALQFDRQKIIWTWTESFTKIWQQKGPELLYAKDSWAQHPGLMFLKYAAVIGTRFSSGALQGVVPHEDIRCHLHETLQDAVKSGLILPIRNGEFHRFQQNSQQDCSFLFVGKSGRESILAQIKPAELGTIHEQIFRMAEHSSIGPLGAQGKILAARYLNRASELEGKFPAELIARVNLDAAREARRYCDYELSIQLLQSACAGFRPDRWTQYYQLCLDIFNERAANALMFELRDELDSVVREVVENARSPVDSFACQEVMIEYLLENNIFQGLVYGKQVMADLGVKVPARADRKQVIWEIFKILLLGDPLRVLMGVFKQGALQSQSLHLACRLGGRLASASYLVEPFLTPLYVCRTILVCQRNGSIANLPVVCQSFALIILELTGSYTYAKKLSLMGRQQAALSNDASIANRADFLYLAFIRPWLEPISRSCEALLSNFQKSLDCGDYEFATHAFNMYSIYSFLSGRNLQIYIDEMQKYSGILQELHQDHLLPHRAVFIEAAAVLLGETGDALQLRGQYFDEVEYSNYIHTVKDCKFYYHTARLMLAYYAEAWVEAEQHAQEAHALREAAIGSWAVVSVYFYEALSVIRLASTTSGGAKRGLIRRVGDLQRSMQVWMRRVPSNIQNRTWLLEAELAFLKGDFEEALSACHHSIQAARASGFIHEEALAAERLGQMYKERGLDESSQHFLSMAMQRYAVWGAQRKVESIKQHLPFKQLALLDIKLNASNQIESQSFRTAIADISRESDDRQLFKKLVAYAAQLSGAQAGKVLVRDEITHRWTIISSILNGQVEVKDPELSHDPSAVCWPVIGYIERTRSKLVIDDANVTQSLLPGLEKELYIAKSGVRAIVCLPIITGDRDSYELLGVLYLEHRQTSHAFNQQKIEILELLAQIAAGRIELSAKASSLEASFREVRQVQGALLPTQAVSSDYAISHYYRSAEISGGDWFGYHEDLVARRLYLFVGDVTGHGVPSSLITGTAAGSIYSTLYAFRAAGISMGMEETLLALVQASNRVVLETGAKVDRLMTMAFVCIDTETGAGSMISAGHQPGLLLGRDRISGLKAAGSPLGHRVDGKWKARSFQLEKGDAVFLFTDGLLENIGPQGEKINFRSLEKIFETSRSPVELRKQILEEAFLVWKEHKPSDDVTFLLVRWGELADKSLTDPWRDTA